jgi:cysteinyl-tRNA synthetase
MLTAHYRSKLNFSWVSLTAAQNALNKLYEEISTYDPPKVGCAEYEQNFLEAVNDDLNTAKGLAVVWDLLKSEYPGHAKLQSLIKFDKILGLKIEEVWKAAKTIPQVVRKLVDDREDARKNKDFVRSDELRRAIESNGYLIEDTPDGFRIKKKFNG